MVILNETLEWSIVNDGYVPNSDEVKYLAKKLLYDRRDSDKIIKLTEKIQTLDGNGWGDWIEAEDVFKSIKNIKDEIKSLDIKCGNGEQWMSSFLKVIPIIEKHIGKSPYNE